MRIENKKAGFILFFTQLLLPLQPKSKSWLPLATSHY